MGWPLLILLILLILVMLAVVPAWPHSRGWGYYPSGGAGLLVIIVLIVLVLFYFNAIPGCRVDVDTPNPVRVDGD